jgi:tRNA splicing endonuclease
MVLTASVKNLINFGRLATNVKKSYLIAYVDENRLQNGNPLMDNNKIIFTCISWSHI